MIQTNNSLMEMLDHPGMDCLHVRFMGLVWCLSHGGDLGHGDLVLVELGLDGFDPSLLHTLYR